MERKRLVTLLGSVCLILIFAAMPLLTACPAAPEEVTPEPEEVTPEKLTYHWRFSDYSPSGSPSAIASKRFAEKVLEASNGRIVIDVYDSEVLGDWVMAFEEVMRGTIEMAMALTPAAYDPRFELLGLPYLVNSYEQAGVAFSPTGLLYEINCRILEDVGIKGLAAWPRGFGGIAFTRLPPSPSDPDVDKEMKIRIWASKTVELLTERFGYMPTVIPGAESFQALQTGVVEAAIGCDPVTAWEHWRDVMNYWLQINDHYEISWFIINLDLWNSLSDEDQQILMDVALEESVIRFGEYVAQEDEYRQKFRDYGIEVIIPTQEELDKCAAVAREDIWPEVEPRIGKALMDEITAYLEKL